MIFKNTMLSAIDYFLPDTKITSTELEEELSPIYKRLKLPEGRLELMTGIKERRFWEPGTRPSMIAAEAAKKLLKKININKGEIDLLIHASVCRDFLEPSTASVVHHALDLKPECNFFDLSNACLGVINSIMVAANMIEQGSIKRALIVSGENGGPLLKETIEYLNGNMDISRKSIKKYIANLTIGSAGVACLVSHKDFDPTGHQILGAVSMQDSSANILCQGDGTPHSLMMETDSEELMKAGVKLATKTWKKTKEILNVENEDLNWVLGHQVGSAHEKLTMETLKLDKTPTHITYPYLGNTGSAALPITLAKLEETGNIRREDLVALLGIGSGLSSIMMGVKW